MAKFPYFNDKNGNV